MRPIAFGDLVADLGPRLRAEPPGRDDLCRPPGGDHVLNAGLVAADGPPPRLAAVLIGIVDRPEPTVILTRRASTLRRHSGQIALPGGRIDPGDASPLAAALREADEEIGLSPALVRPLGYLDAYLSGSGFLVLPVVGAVSPGYETRLNPDEVDEAFEVPLAFLLDEANHELHAREWNGIVRQYYAMPFGRHYIWGVTAGILRNLFERLQ